MGVTVFQTLLESVNLLFLLFFHKYTQTFLWISILLFYHSKTFFLILTLTLLLFVTNLEQLTLRYFFLAESIFQKQS